VFTTTATEEERLMDRKRVAGHLRRYRDVLARQQAEQRLDEMEASIIADRQSRGYQPVVTDTGQVIRWVPTRVDTRNAPHLKGKG
jgi:pyruvate/oxaloacetate carboxyltransferase